MKRKKGGRAALVIAGLGFGLAGGVSLGALVIAPAVDGSPSAGPATGAASESAESTVEDATARAERAEQESAAANEVLASRSEQLVGDALAGQAVVMIRTPDVSDEELDKQRWLLNAARSDDAGTMTLTDKFLSQDAANELSAVIAQSLPAGAQLSVDNRAPGVHAGEALAAALFGDAEDRMFLLETLRETGFIRYDEGLGMPAAGAVLLGGDTAELTPTTFAGQLVHDLTGSLGRAGDQPVVLAIHGPNDAAAPEGSIVVPFAGTEAGRVDAVFAVRREGGEA